MSRFLAFVTNAKDGTVSTFSLDAEGSLERIAVSDVGPGCSTLVVDETRGRVHVAVKGDPAKIVTTQVEPDGGLRILSTRDVPSGLHYLALTPDGSTMIAASYGGGFGISLPVDEDGVGEIISRIDHPNVHSCAVGPGGSTAYFVSLGADLVAQCALADGVLTPLDPPTAAAPAGSGPRHLVLDSAGENLYVLTEFSGEVLHYRRDPAGTLEFVSATAAYAPDRGLRHSRFGADPTAEHLIWGADLHWNADQSVLWASERSESTLATIPVGEDGAPQPAAGFVPTEPQPRGFAVSPDGRHLLCTGERSTTVSLFAASPDGTLTLQTQAETGNGANWVRFLSE